MLAALRSVALVTFSALALAAPALGFDRDPVGESAYYEVDRASSRTSSMVRSGNLTARVLRHHADTTPPSYDVKIDYTFRIQLMGTRSGSKEMQFDAVYFTPEFMTQLRADGEYHGAKFKVRHLGIQDARTMDGRFYPACDRILIYDIDAVAASGIFDVAKAMLGVEAGVLNDDIEDMEIRAHIKYGVPVIGAVKLDVTGKYQGMSIKAGADYRAP